MGFWIFKARAFKARAFKARAYEARAYPKKPLSLSLNSRGVNLYSWVP